MKKIIIFCALSLSALQCTSGFSRINAGPDSEDTTDENNQTAVESPANLQVTVTGTASFSVSWDDLPAGLKTELCWSTQPGGCDPFTVLYTVDSGDSPLIENLQAATTYYVSARTAFRGLYSAATTEVSVTTTAEGSSTAPSFSTAGGYYNETIYPCFDGAAPTATVCYTTDGSEPACLNDTCLEGQPASAGACIALDSSLTLKALSCEAGLEQSSISEADYTFDYTPPAAPSAPAVQSLTSRAFLVSYTAGSDETTVEADLVYEACYHQQDAFCTNFTAMAVSQSGALEVVASGLTSGDTYYISVRSRDQAGNTSSPVTVTSSALPSAGSLDTSFNADGLRTATFGSDAWCNAVAEQSSGRLIFAGYGTNTDSDIAVIGVTPDGSNDGTFGNAAAGKTEIDLGGSESVQTIAIQPDDKIIVGGFLGSDLSIIRLNADGNLDTDFGSSGVATSGITGFVYALSIYNDGRILAAGSSASKMALARFLPDGSLDTTFSGDGTLIIHPGGGITSSVHDVTVQDDGKIVLFGIGSETAADFAVVRLNDDGSYDTSFNSTGYVKTDFNGGNDFGYGGGIDSNGRYYVSGIIDNGDNEFGIARLTTAGILDTTFAGNGKKQVDFNGEDDRSFKMVIDANNKVIAVGHATISSNQEAAVLRIKTGGAADTDFNGNGKITQDFGGSVNERFLDVILDSYGRIVACGYKNLASDVFTMARYYP